MFTARYVPNKEWQTNHCLNDAEAWKQFRSGANIILSAFESHPYSESDLKKKENMPILGMVLNGIIVAPESNYKCHYKYRYSYVYRYNNYGYGYGRTN